MDWARTVSLHVCFSRPLVDGCLSTIDGNELKVAPLLRSSALVSTVVDGDELLAGRLERVQHQERVQQVGRVQRARLGLESCRVKMSRTEDEWVNVVRSGHHQAETSPEQGAGQSRLVLTFRDEQEVVVDD